MRAQTELEGRFLGGRPPYGYRIADAGPHPNPAKAADGRQVASTSCGASGVLPRRHLGLVPQLPTSGVLSTGTREWTR
jgi:hypothetical protein